MNASPQFLTLSSRLSAAFSCLRAIVRRIWPMAALTLLVLMLEASAAQPQMVYTLQMIEGWIFQQDQNAANARRRLESHLTIHLEEIDRSCKLTEPQKKKLQLAGRGDVKHFFDRYEKLKRNYKPIRQDQPDFQDAYQNLWQEISPLQQSLQNGLYEEDSLFGKSVLGTLTPAQQVGYTNLLNERLQFNYRIAISQTIEALDRSMRFTQEQRRHLTDLLTKETKTPKQITLQTYYDQNYVLWQLSLLPEAKFKPLFDDQQRKILDRRLDQAKNVARSMRRNPMWPGFDPNDEDAKPSAPKSSKLLKIK